MTTNLFVIANVKQLRTGGSFRILLPFLRASWCVGVLNSAIFKFSQSGWVWRDFGGPSEFRGGGGYAPQTPPPPTPARHWFTQFRINWTVSHFFFFFNISFVARFEIYTLFLKIQFVWTVGPWLLVKHYKVLGAKEEPNLHFQDQAGHCWSASHYTGSRNQLLRKQNYISHKTFNVSIL